MNYEKDLDVLKVWFVDAYSIATDKGLKRIIRADKFIQLFLNDDSFAFTTVDSEREHVVDMFVDYLLEIEKLCDLIDKGEFRESLFSHNIVNTCYW